jgi:hypothetical protein
MRGILLITKKRLVTTYKHCGMIPEPGSKFLHPRLQMKSTTSEVPCFSGSKEATKFFLTRQKETKILENKGFQGGRQS